VNLDDALASLLDQWIETSLEAGHVGALAKAENARPHLQLLLEDNSHRTAEELEEIAYRLSPGGVHTGGLLTRLCLNSVDFSADPLLLAALIRYNWHGGAAGVQFLPDPAHDFDEYLDEVATLESVLEDGIAGDPLRILTELDRDFFISLPERFTIYRGCAGITWEQTAEGLCWTLKRDIADWFAERSARFNNGDPVVVSARIPKTRIYFAKASEHEVVVKPRRARAIKVRPVRRRPQMEWVPSHAHARPKIQSES
jgi:hypothetical protein